MTALAYLFGDPTEKVSWARKDDVYGDPIYGGRRTIAHLEWTNQQSIAEFGVELEVLQGGFNTDVEASAGTHDLDGCIDMFIPGVDWWAQQAFFRRCGWAAWYRYPPLFGRHIHAISLGCPGRVGVYVPGQIDDYYRHALGLKDQHHTGADTSWFPRDIDATIFDFALWERELEDDMPSYKDWTEAEKDEQAQRIAKAVWAHRIEWASGKAKRAAEVLLTTIHNRKG